VDRRCRGRRCRHRSRGRSWRRRVRSILPGRCRNRGRARRRCFLARHLLLFTKCVPGGELDGEGVVDVPGCRAAFLAMGPVLLRLLIEDHVPGDVDTTRHRIIGPVRLGSPLVADEDHLAPTILQLLEVCCRVPHIGDAAERLQVMDRRLLPVPSFEWRHVVTVLVGHRLRM
jgi:hypothetical protein